MSSIPYLKRENGIATLMVDDKPFLCLGGEIHNSSSSSLEYMDDVVWPALRPLNMNTVIAPVYWELCEPEEGVYDFSLMEGLIQQCRRENIRLVILWFGLWKNGISQYVPGWVKRDSKRFFRIRDKFGKPLEVVSPFCKEGVAADKACYIRMMERLKEIDGETHTVITIQVENEIGTLYSERDFGPQAQAAFDAEVPSLVAETFGVSGTWEQAFGQDSHEMLMAYTYGRAVEEIASAGKAIYPLPLYVNCWLDQHPPVPGAYPTGGPIAKNIPMWKCAAPSIDFCAPDIYVEDFGKRCREFAVPGNPLFIPETSGAINATPNCLYAVGGFNTLCFAPFAIEDIMAPEVLASDPDYQLTSQLRPAMMRRQQGTLSGQLLARTYTLLQNMTELLLKARAEGRVHAWLQFHDQGTVIHLQKYDLEISYGSGMVRSFGAFNFPDASIPEGAPIAGGFIIEEDADNFILVGVGSVAKFTPKLGEARVVGLVRKEEGKYVDGVWQRRRVLNGDEGYVCRMDYLPQVLRVELTKYE